MDNSYVAGFFDGEGSAMALTVKRVISGRITFRIRPVIKIAQGTQEILCQIRNYLGYGNVVGASGGCYALQINSNKHIIEFANTIGGHLILKKRQVQLLKELAEYQDTHFSNVPYTRDAMEHMLNLRDAVFEANTWTRTRIMQKYSKQTVLEQHEFIDIEAWAEHRENMRRDKVTKRFCH
jgi:hypothetical protein